MCSPSFSSRVQVTNHKSCYCGREGAMFRLAMGFACLALLSSCATTLEVSPAVRSDLAPTGKLRVGINYGNPLFATRDRATGEPSGIAIDLARELGRRTGIPVEL